jgi:hypothetical protein
MSRCALRRWGSGVTCTKEPDTAASREMGEKLAAMRAERERQDGMWGVAEQQPHAAPIASLHVSANTKGHTQTQTLNTLPLRRQ